MINYTEKGAHLHEVISDAGHTLVEQDGIFVSSDDVAVQAIIDSYDPLPALKKAKRLELKKEYRNKLIAIYPDAEDIDENVFDFTVDICFDIFRSVIGSSRSPNADWQNVLDTRQAKRDIRTEINALTVDADIISYDVVTNVLWP